MVIDSSFVKIEVHQSKPPVISCNNCKNMFAIFVVLETGWMAHPESPKVNVALVGGWFNYCPECGARLERGGLMHTNEDEQ